jgi:hypothetical protein
MRFSENDIGLIMRLEAMALRAKNDPAWLERLEQATLCARERWVMLYGDYLLRELGAWQ